MLPDSRARKRWMVIVAVVATAASANAPAHGAPAPEARADASTSSAATCRPGSRHAIRITGWLKACGTVLVDSERRKVRLFGLNVNDMIRGSGGRADPVCGRWKDASQETLDQAERWGFNAISLMVTWGNLEPLAPVRTADGLRHRWSRTYLKAIDAAVAEARERGLAVILTMVQSRWSPAFENLELPDGSSQPCGIGMPTWLYPAGGGVREMVQAERAFFRNSGGKQGLFIQAWEKLASRYKTDRSVVGAVLLTEAYAPLSEKFPGMRPIQPAALNLAGFYEKVGRAVHRANPHLLSIYWDQLDRRTGQFAVTRRPQVPNGVYSFEFYSGTWKPDGVKRMAALQQRGHGWGDPVTIGEFTAFNYSRKVYGVPFSPHWQRDTRAVLVWARNHRVGWNIAGEVDWRLGPILRQGR